MAKVMQDTMGGKAPAGDTPPTDEEAGARSKPDQEQNPMLTAKRKYTIWLWIALATIVLVFGLAVGLSQKNNQEDNATEAASTVANPNLAIFDEAVAMIEANPRQFKDLPSGETISYREYNKGGAHKVVALPGYMADDTSFSVLAVLPEFQDHHIIAVNPIGWWESTMNTPIYNHEENADEVIELMKLIGIDKAMAFGYSTGGGIAYYMAQKYPKEISTAFLTHSIPLHGVAIFDESGTTGVMDDIDEVEKLVVGMVHDDMKPGDVVQSGKMFSADEELWSPSIHKLNEYGFEARTKMPGKAAAMIANSKFNVTPIKTRYAKPSDALKDLKSKIVVIHSENDCWKQMIHVTQLAITDQWAPPGMISYYDDGEGHMVLYDNPALLAKVYRIAFEEQVL